jgi:hypothetical protein
LSNSRTSTTLAKKLAWIPTAAMAPNARGVAACEIAGAKDRVAA